MEQVLEQTCRSLPNGGDHDVRAFIAERLAVAAEDGWTTLGELGIVARKGLADYTAKLEHEAPVIDLAGSLVPEAELVTLHFIKGAAGRTSPPKSAPDGGLPLTSQKNG